MTSLSSLFPLFSVSMVGTGSSRDETDEAALETRIRKLRMGELVVKAAPGAEIHVEQKRHEFLFGTAIANGLAENAADAFSPSDRKTFLSTLAANFNYAVHENALKWYDCEKEEGKVDYGVADRIWERCHELGVPMRGHCIYWEKEKLCMDWLKPLNNERLRAVVVRRGIDVTRHFRGRIGEFDLNNEMINGEFFRNRFGFGIVNEMAWIAKAGNPDAVLFVNDYGILVEGGFNLESYVEQITALLASGVPIGGIGCQGHAGTDSGVLMDPVHVQKALDLLARFQLPIKITECLFDVGDEETQAAQLRIIFPIYFAHPAVEAILMWGFWAGSHWKPWSALWRKDWSITPQGEAFRELVYERWWTKVAGKANAHGVFRTDAFFGEYEVKVKGKTKTVLLTKKEKTSTIDFT